MMSQASRYLYPSIGLLILLNIWALFSYRAKSMRKNPVPYDLPMTGRIIEETTFTDSNQRSITVPSPNHSATFIYTSRCNQAAFGELALVETMARSSFAQSVMFIWINLDASSSRHSILYNMDFSFPVVPVTRHVLNGLTLANPRPNNLIILDQSGEVMYDGPLSTKFTNLQIMDLVSSIPTFNSEISPGARIIGSISGERGRIDFTKMNKPTILLLYAGYCNVCGNEELYRILVSLKSYDLYAILPKYDSLSGIYDEIRSMNIDMDFYFMDSGNTSLNIDQFMLGYPVLIVIISGRIIMSSTNPTTDHNIINDIMSLKTEFETR